MSNKRPNPRRVPRTQADVDRAFKDGEDAGIEVILTLATYALLDKCGADGAFITHFSNAVRDVCDSMNRGYVSYPDIVRDLKATHGFTVELLLTKPVCVDRSAS